MNEEEMMTREEEKAMREENAMAREESRLDKEEAKIASDEINLSNNTSFKNQGQFDIGNAKSDNNKGSLPLKIFNGIRSLVISVVKFVGDVTRALFFGTSTPFDYKSRMEAEEKIKMAKENNKKDRSSNENREHENISRDNSRSSTELSNLKKMDLVRTENHCSLDELNENKKPYLVVVEDSWEYKTRLGKEMVGIKITDGETSKTIKMPKSAFEKKVSETIPKKNDVLDVTLYTESSIRGDYIFIDSISLMNNAIRNIEADKEAQITKRTENLGLIKTENHHNLEDVALPEAKTQNYLVVLKSINVDLSNDGKEMAVMNFTDGKTTKEISIPKEDVEKAMNGNLPKESDVLDVSITTKLVLTPDDGVQQVIAINEIKCINTELDEAINSQNDIEKDDTEQGTPKQDNEEKSIAEKQEEFSSNEINDFIELTDDMYCENQYWNESDLSIDEDELDIDVPNIDDDLVH